MKKGRLLTVLLAAMVSVFCALTFGACDAQLPVAVTGVTLSSATLEIEEGKTETLTATVAPENATNKAVTWESSDTAIATVADGVVTAVKAGTATITVTTTDGGKTATCEITVTAAAVQSIAVTGVTLSSATLGIEEGKNETLTATVAPEDATNKAVSWESSDDTVATVADGVVTAVKAGTATITVTTADGGKTATCEVTVKAAIAEGSAKEKPFAVTIGETEVKSAELDVDKTYWFKVTVAETTEVQFAYGFVVGTDGYIDDGEFTLYDANDAVVQTGTGSEQAFATFKKELVAGDYYFAVKANGNKGKYTVTFSIAQEEVIPGSTKAAAVAVELDEQTAVRYGTLTEYWLAFTATQTGKLRVYAEGNSAYSQNNTVVLYDDSDAVLQQNTAVKVALYQQVTEGKTYYIKLSATLTSYDPTVLLQMVQDGDYKDIAKQVTFGTPDSVALAAGQKFYYAFTVGEPQVITVALGGSADGVEFTLDTAAANTAEVTYLTPGTYYLTLNNKGTADATFTVTVTSADVPEIPEGSTREKPFVIAATLAGVTKEDLAKNQDQWFKISATENRTVTVKVSDTAGGLDYDYVWYDGETETEGTVRSFTKEVQAGKEYYLQFKADKSSVQKFAVTVSALPNGSSKAEALAAKVGDSAALTAGEHWFVIKESSACDAILYADGEVDAELQNANGEAVQPSAVEDGRIYVTFAANTTYYLKVTATDSATVHLATPGPSQELAAMATTGKTYTVQPASDTQYWFAYTVPQTGILKVTVGGSIFNAETRTAILLYEDEPVTAKTDGNFSLTQSVTAAQVYYLKVSSGKYGSSSTVKFEVVQEGSEKALAKTATFENDTFSDTITVEANKDFWYKFTITKASVVTVTLGDGAENVQCSSDNATVAGNKLTYATTGDCYLKLSNAGASAATFTITLAREDRKDPGSAKEVAFEVGTVSYAGYTSNTFSDKSEYWFKFTVAQEQSVDITFIKIVTGEQEMSAAYVLYDSNDTKLENGSRFIGYGDQVLTKVLTGGTYYLQVSCSASKEYAVKVARTPDGSEKDGAIKAEIGKSNSVTVSGEYWFTFMSATAQDVILYSAKGTNASTENNVIAELQSASGEVLASSENTTGNFRIDYEVAASATYYLKVTTEDETPDYTVFFALPGASKETAADITIGETATTTINTSSDKRFYKFTPTKTTKVKISLSGANFASKLHKPDETTVALTGYSPSTTMQFEQGKTYYLEVGASVYYSTSCTIKTEYVYGDSKDNPQVAELGKSYSVTIEKDGDNYTWHWFAIELDTATKVKISSSGSNYSGYVRQAQHLQSDATTSIQFIIGDKDFSYEYEFAASTKYYFRVSMRGTGSYSVKFEVAPQTVTIPKDEATQVTPGSKIATLTKDVTYWYTFTLTGDSASTVYIYSYDNDVEGVNPQYVTYELYNEQGELQKANDTWRLQYFIDGTYYLKVVFTGTNGCDLYITYPD